MKKLRLGFLIQSLSIILAREQIIELENLAKQQVLIYEDACDMGIIKTPEIREQIVRICKELKDEGIESKIHRWHSGVSMTFFVPIEKDEGETWGLEIVITESHDKARRKDFYSIMMNRKAQD